ncbi:glycerophosphodiester phosphodiesterase family protein [Pararhodobacter sp. CCB-MM2]|uniref:glycerophosphodiester phosphodiesterase family protein n=1 Tax=Pararhodobacter sp. CCB-MM2 TaxID=1786003 RepID=UPI00082D8150|nr:glycerophosphodiester phosphodiesterase family protein [Pararhodobacter sp. CCB-MM2]
MRVPLHPDFLRLPVAHRALHDAGARRPENSLPAIRAAIREGYAIEIDLQPSADGEAMVFHDDVLDRLTYETGPINARTKDELQRIRVRSSAEPIPTFRQVLDEVAGQVPLLVEIKDQSGNMGPTNGLLEAATAAALQGYGGPVAVMSFNPSSVEHMQRLAPQIARGLTTYPFPRDHFPEDIGPEMEAHRQSLAAIADYDHVGASFISHLWRDLDNPRVAELKAQGAAILCWTIRSAEDEAQARQVAENVTFEGYMADRT